jgi:hypothetical protein
VAALVVTNRELQAAAVFKGDYYLIGVQHSEGIPANQWVTYMTPDPILRLMSLGEFVVETKLQVTACSLFDFRQNGSDTIDGARRARVFRRRSASEGRSPSGTRLHTLDETDHEDGVVD